MAILLEVVKESAESFVIGVNFAARLADGETISTPAATSKKRSDSSDSTATIVNGSATVSTTWVLARVHQGTSGDAHLVRLQATTSDGNVWVGVILLTITDAV